MSEIRTRFAPSPTGSLHIGGIRTALYCYAWAKKNNGKFVVRIEDTDQTRFVEGAIEEVFEMLDEYHLTPDESIQHGGSYGPYLQSERKDIYIKYAKELVSKGYAYYCFLQGEELKQIQESFKGKGFRSPFRGQDVAKSKEMIQEGKPYVIRLKVPNNETIDYVDGVQGRIKFDSNMVGDEILIKSNGMSSYHLAVVVDDHLMGISHVFRAMEWLPSTPKQVLIYRYLGWEMPPFYHPSSILDPAGGKLSKRKGSVAAKEFLRDGYLADAVNNFLMLLGWASPEKREFGETEREIFSLEEFVRLFHPKDLNKSNPVFNREKLLWFNQQYIKNKENDELAKVFISWMGKYNKDDLNYRYIEKDFNEGKLSEKISLVKERAKTLNELNGMLSFFYSRTEKINWNVKQVENFSDKIQNIIVDVKEVMESLPENSKEWDQNDWVEKMRAISNKYGLKNGDSFMVLRMAVVGEPFSPPLFEAMQILGKQITLERINSAK